MAKIVDIASSSSSSNKKFQLKRHKLLGYDDRISKLPDELISSIVSHLTITEAARTSVLSRRWKLLWYFYSGSLVFDVRDKILLIPRNLRKQGMFDYLTWMSQVLESVLSLESSSSVLDAFVVRFCNFDERCRAHLDRCVEFAMKKRIKRFELDTVPRHTEAFVGPQYNFPVEFYAWIKTPYGLYNISFLTSISLNRVNVSDDLIQHLLVNCPLLESLWVKKSPELLNPKFIGGTALKLKYLEVLSLRLESIEICTPNLFSLITEGQNINFLIRHAPKLVNLSISVDIINFKHKSVSSYLPHLESLTLDFGLSDYGRLLHRFEELYKLKHLTWKVVRYHDELTNKLNSLIEATPFLHKFTLVIHLSISCPKKPLRKVTSKHRHRSLKVLEIIGFTGSVAEVKLVRYFIANTTSLEKIILDIQSPFERGNPWEGNPARIEQRKKSARKLEKYLPVKVSLLII